MKRIWNKFFIKRMKMARLPYMLYQPYKWLIFLPLFVLATVFFIMLGILIFLFFDSNMASRTTGVWWSRFACFTTPICVTVRGRDNVAKGQSYVVAANHVSLYDILVLYGFLKIDIKWAMKVELLRIPLFGLAGKLGGNIYIDRSNPTAAYATLRAAKEKLIGGISLMMLPEGTRSRTGQLLPFKSGAFVISSELNLPILPVSIIGTSKILPPDTFNLFPGRVMMIIHPSMDPDDFAGDIEAFKTAIRDVIQGGIIRYENDLLANQENRG